MKSRSPDGESAENPLQKNSKKSPPNKLFARINTCARVDPLLFPLDVLFLLLLQGEGGLEKRSKEVKPFPEYFVFSEVELFSLILCIFLDISEYVAAVLIMPAVGDLLDVAGIIACLVIFRWVGLVSLFELVPGADILPIFIITWLVWYFLKRHEREEGAQSNGVRSLKRR